MADRRLTADEATLWRRVMDNVRPIAAVRVAKPKPKPATFRAAPAEPAPAAPDAGATWDRVLGDVRPLRGRALAPRTAQAPPAPEVRRVAAPAVVPPPRASREVVRANTLDGSWDKSLARGAVSPDSTVDLHGHTLQSAHGVLDQGLARAIARGDRVLLLVTGKPPRPESERPHARGAIRAAVADWLAQSRHADRIAAVRGAHPRHGGNGALYIILRRRKFAHE